MAIILGTDSADRILGTADPDDIYGMAGDDILDGRLPSRQPDMSLMGDILTGGEGNDSYLVDHVLDLVREINGQGYDRVFSTTSYQLS